MAFAEELGRSGLDADPRCSPRFPKNRGRPVRQESGDEEGGLYGMGVGWLWVDPNGKDGDGPT